MATTHQGEQAPTVHTTPPTIDNRFVAVLLLDEPAFIRAVNGSSDVLADRHWSRAVSAAGSLPVHALTSGDLTHQLSVLDHLARLYTPNGAWLPPPTPTT